MTVHGQDGAAGGGIVVAPGKVLTCAHVVSAAAGLKHGDKEPAGTQLGHVRVEFLVARGCRYGVRIAAWEPPREQEHGQWWEGDLALLELTEEGPNAEPARFREAAPDTTLWTRYGTGMPRSALRLSVYSHAAVGDWYEILPDGTGLHVREGNSGGGIWDRNSGLMAGLIVSGVPGSPRSYAIRTEAITKFLMRAGVTLLYGPKLLCNTPALYTVRETLAEALSGIIPPWQWDEWAFHIASDLGSPYHPTTPDELADVIVAHERGLPLLERVLPEHVSSQVRQELREAAESLAAVRGTRLLTPAEFQKLIAHLGQNALPELLAAANQGLRLVGFSPQDYADITTLVVALEELPTGPRMVPPLLQAVEEMAARRGWRGKKLQKWSSRKAHLFGVSDEALMQVRENARRASDSQHRPAMIRARLRRTHRVGHYLYVIRAYTGNGTLIEAWECERTPAPREEVCERLADAVRALAARGRPPHVEFTLDDEDFDVPVESWPIPVPGLGTRALGIDRPVVLRGVEMAEAWSWREERWRNRETAQGGPVVLCDEDDVEDYIARETSVACAVLSCPAGQRTALLKLCRYLGLPVALWHRSAHSDDTARAVSALIGARWADTLPDDVRQQRLSARKDNTHLGAHLALMWDEPRENTDGWAGRTPSERGNVA
ncbi:VMAP-C domain-containing protein [Streptomyces chartreusis]